MRHSFYSALKRGLGAQVAGRANAVGLPSGLSAVVEIEAEGAGLPKPVVHALSLRGPGTITGFDATQILRTEPGNGAVGFEYNMFPFVEFAAADLPWRFTPALPDGQGRLTPWIALVVLREDDQVSCVPKAGGASVLEIRTDAGARLPRANQAHLWAHVHATEQDGVDRQIARLVCPARLDENAPYLACIVPVFEAGRRAGLGLEIEDPNDPALAWSSTDQACQLPVYYFWRFRTGRDDFEELARRLYPVAADPRMGLHAVDVADPGSGLGAGELGLAKLAEKSGGHLLVDYAGALTAPRARKTAWPARHKTAFQAALRQRIAPKAAAARDRAGAYDPLLDDPVVGPPHYGGWQTGLDAPRPGWSEDVNLDPTHRLSAGLAARSVRRDQERLMAEAWRQARNAREAETVMRRARLAIGVGGAVHRRFSALPEETQLQITSRAHASIVLPASGRSVSAELARTTATPEGALDPAFLRVAVRAEKLATKAKLPKAGATTVISKSAKVIAAQSNSLASLGTIRVSNTKSYDSDVELTTSPAPVAPAGKTARTRASKAKVAPQTMALTESSAAGLKPADLAAGTLEKVQPKVPVKRRNPASAANRTRTLMQALPGAVSPLSLLPDRAYGRVTGVPKRRFAPLPVPRSVHAPVRFVEPTYEELARQAPEVLVPGIGGLALNAVTLVETNPEFIAAYLVGMNHEMSREFAWRGFPALLHGTWFHRFWDYTEDQDDIEAIAGWPLKSPLAQRTLGAQQGSAVVLTRAELLQRHPDTMVYAVPARWHRSGKRRTVTARELKAAQAPAFTGRLGKGASFYGFSLTAPQMVGSRDPNAENPGWFVVFEELPSAPRFGLDAAESYSPRSAPALVNDLSWGHFAAGPEDLQALLHAPANPAWKKTPVEGARWGRSAADMAKLTWQRPVRVLIHADTLVG